MPNQEIPKAFAVELSNALQELHRALIRAESGDDPVLQNSPYSMLFALINDPRFAWMGFLSRLIARLDEWIAKVEEREVSTLKEITNEAADLFAGGDGEASGFRMQHVMALQKEPAVGLATGRVRRVLADRPAILR